MGQTRKNQCFVSMRSLTVFILFIASLAHINALDGIRPTITPSDSDVSYLPTENRTFTCESTEPVKWHFPIKDDAFEANFETIDLENEGMYESILKLNQIDHTFVGYYYCVKKDADNTNIEDSFRDGHASRIYLFVEDSLHPVYEPLSPIIEGYEGQKVLIPCKPTSKLYSVKLVKERDESHQFERTFDIHEGYRVPLYGLTDGGYFSCHSQEDENIVADFHVVVHSAPSHLSNSKINLNTENYGIVGEALEFNCTVDYNLDSKIRMNWELPNGSTADLEDRVEIKEPQIVRAPGDPPKHLAVGQLKVRNVKETDKGRYVCLVEDNANHSNKLTLNVLRILAANDSFINIEDSSGKFVLEMAANKPEAKWYVKYAGYPRTTIVWHDPNKNEIPWRQSENKENKIEAMNFGSSTILKIRNPTIRDSGIYNLVAKNERKEKKQEFTLYVRETPHVTMSDVTIKPGDKANVTCNIYGYPTSTVTWSYIPCENATFDSASCGKDSNKITFSNDVIKTIEISAFNQTSNLMFRPNRTGLVTCRAVNRENSTTTSASVILSDLDEDLLIWTNNESPIAIGDEVFLSCGASAHKYSGGIEWFKDDNVIENSEDDSTMPHIETNNTKYSYRKTLHWNSIPKEANGIYSCQARVIKDDSQEKKSRTLNLTEPTKAHIIDSNINEKEKEHKFGEPLQMTCIVSGIPRPTIQWYKDNQEISTNKKILLHNDDTVLDIKYVTIEDEGNYKCVVSNRLGTDIRETNLKIKDVPKVPKFVVIGVIIVILILVVCTIYLCLRIRRERRLFRELKAAGLVDFERGNPDSINPELAVDEQADLLPYDKKYEFPREKIKLGKQLGAGAFGVVIKGYAHGIVPHEEETTVAVKMVKHMADNEVMRALISELKIMVHLGQHLNVVNLLGAVTKNITKREVMVIVEYCRFGNLQNFLVKHREYFIDQIVRDKDIIDPNILTKDQRWSNDSGYAYYNRPESDRQSLGAVSHANSAYIPHSNVNDYFSGGMDSANTEATLISRNSRPGGEDNMVLSNNSNQPAWRSNYRMDYKGPARSVTTTDLLCWAFQVARGMEYLASRKVLHGDLAARNILLCDDNVVKICDFGLARSMYKSDNYHKKGESPLPFKWLALESISDQIFSTYSDVWSFGIVLWELFSLGKVPYPGMDADQGLYFKLKDGYRMEKPDFATQDIYDIMLSCWCANPESRPLFHSLEKSIGKLLENSVAEHYIDLNEPYLKSNVSNFEEGHVDYLSSMAAPDCPPPAIPSYVNGHVGLLQQVPCVPTQQSYITMNQPTTGDGVNTHNAHFQFSPTTANNPNAFEQGSKFRNKISNIPEEIPMLKRSNQSIHSDSDTEANYVNVPTAITTKTDAISNPGYVVVTNVNETKT